MIKNKAVAKASLHMKVIRADGSIEEYNVPIIKQTRFMRFKTWLTSLLQRAKRSS